MNHFWLGFEKQSHASSFRFKYAAFGNIGGMLSKGLGKSNVMGGAAKAQMANTVGAIKPKMSISPAPPGGGISGMGKGGIS